MSHIRKVIVLLVSLLSSMSLHAFPWREYTPRITHLLLPCWASIVSGIGLINCYHKANTTTDNAWTQWQYPRAFAYVQEQIRKHHISQQFNIVNVQPEKSSITPHILSLPLAALERTLERQSEAAPLTAQQSTDYGEALYCIFHELGHAKDHVHIKECIAPFVAAIAVETLTHFCPSVHLPIPKFLKTASLLPIKIVSIGTILLAYDHWKEYKADTFAIKILKKEHPQGLIDAAHFHLTNQQQYPVYKTHNPIKSTVWYWLNDAHSSNIARAHRFLKAAEIHSTQWTLAQELQGQDEQAKHFNPCALIDWLFVTPSFDMTPVLEQSKKVVAIEFPRELANAWPQ